MSKTNVIFDVCVVNYRNGKVSLSRRYLPEDIRQDELEEILYNEGGEEAYNSDCVIMFSKTPITIEDTRNDVAEIDTEGLNVEVLNAEND